MGQHAQTHTKYSKTHKLVQTQMHTNNLGKGKVQASLRRRPIRGCYHTLLCAMVIYRTLE